MMDKTQENTLRTLLLLLVIFLIILDYGQANEDQHQTEDLSWALGKPKAAVAMIPDQGPRRERDVGQNNPNNCYPDEYYSDYYRKCKGCTRCSPGTQHDPQEPCGHGQGQEAHCTRCVDGYYQSHNGMAVLTCQPCLMCDRRAVMKRACSRQENTVCGKCQKGWYYNETNVCVECMERDMADPTNEDCYVKPVPTPGPDPDPSTTAFVPSTVDGASSEPLPKPTTGKALSLPIQNDEESVSVWQIGVICGCGAIVAIVLMAVCIRYKLKNKKGKDLPPANDQEMVNLYEEVNEKPNHQRPGPSGPTSDEASNPMGVLMPPSSHQTSSTESIPGSPDGLPVDTSIKQDGPPTPNYVISDTEHLPQPEPAQDSSNDCPLSMPQSLKSFQPVDCGAGLQVPAQPAEGSQSPDEKVDLVDQVTCHEEHDVARNYDVAPDPSLPSAFRSLSSLQQYNNIPRSPHTRV